MLDQSHKGWVIKIAKVLAFLVKFWPKTLFTKFFKRNHWTFEENKDKHDQLLYFAGKKTIFWTWNNILGWNRSNSLPKILIFSQKGTEFGILFFRFLDFNTCTLGDPVSCSLLLDSPLLPLPDEAPLLGTVVNWNSSFTNSKLKN